MRFYVKNEVLRELDTLEENEISVISGEDYNKILNNTVFALKDSEKCGVEVLIVIRTLKSNEILNLTTLLEDDMTVNSKFIGGSLLHDFKDPNGYVTLLGNIRHILSEHLVLDNKIMVETVLRPYGVLYEPNFSILTHVMHLIIQDKDKDRFVESFINTRYTSNWESIESLQKKKDNCKLDRMILDSLPLVKGE